MYQILLIFIGQVYVFPFRLLSHDAVVKFKTNSSPYIWLRLKLQAATSVALDILCESQKPPPGMIHYFERLLNMESILIESRGGNSPVCGQNARVETQEIASLSSLLI